MNVPPIENITPHTGRVLKEDNTPANVMDPLGNIRTISVDHTAVHGFNWMEETV